MTTKSYCIVSGAFFCLVASVHLLRVSNDIAVVIDGYPVPMLASWLGIIIPGALAAWAFRLARGARGDSSATTYFPNRRSRWVNSTGPQSLPVSSMNLALPALRSEPFAVPVMPAVAGLAGGLIFLPAAMAWSKRATDLPKLLCARDTGSRAPVWCQ